MRRLSGPGATRSPCDQGHACPAAAAHHMQVMMTGFRGLIAGASFAVAAAMPAFAAPDVATGLRLCAAITAPPERLACFDALAAGQPAAAPAGLTGRWRQGQATPDRRLVVEQLPLEPWSEEGILLVLSCRNDRVSLSVRRDSTILAGPTVFVTVRVNDRLAPGDVWSAGRDLTEAAYQGDDREFLRQLPETGTLFIRLEGSRRWRFEGTFRLEGLAAIRTRLLADCPR